MGMLAEFSRFLLFLEWHGALSTLRTPRCVPIQASLMATWCPLGWWVTGTSRVTCPHSHCTLGVFLSHPFICISCHMGQSVELVILCLPSAPTQQGSDQPDPTCSLSPVPTPAPWAPLSQVTALSCPRPALPLVPCRGLPSVTLTVLRRTGQCFVERPSI